MECRLRWDLHKVMARTVEGFAPADLEPCATRRDQPVGLGDGEHRVGADHGHNIIIGQSLALIDIEHHKALEESDLPGLAILSPRLLRFRLRCATVGIPYHRPLLSPEERRVGKACVRTCRTR